MHFNEIFFCCCHEVSLKNFFIEYILDPFTWSEKHPLQNAISGTKYLIHNVQCCGSTSQKATCNVSIFAFHAGWELSRWLLKSGWALVTRLRLQYERITRSKHRATRSQGLNTRSHSDKLRFQNERMTRSKQRATRSEGLNTRSHRDKLNLDMKGSQGLNTGRQGNKA